MCGRYTLFTDEEYQDIRKIIDEIEAQAWKRLCQSRRNLSHQFRSYPAGYRRGRDARCGQMGVSLLPWQGLNNHQRAVGNCRGKTFLPRKLDDTTLCCTKHRFL